MAEKKRFAVSYCVYTPGLICIDSEGIVTHDPKSPGPESIIEINESLGYELVDFEELIAQLVDAEVHFRGPDKPGQLSLAEAAQWDLYSKNCVGLAMNISKKLSGEIGV